MRTVGQILKETREEKIYTLEDVEKATKIRKELLVALESDDYTKLPPSTFVQGFIKNYARFLGLDSGKLLAVFRREFSDKKHAPYIMDAFVNPVKEGKWRLTPARVLSGVVVLVVVIFFTYLWFQYRQMVGGPALTISSPADQQTLDNPQVEVQGTTDPDSRVAINSQDVPVDSSGHFSEDITLSSQVNKLVIIATSRFGQTAEADRTVYLRR